MTTLTPVSGRINGASPLYYKVGGVYVAASPEIDGISIRHMGDRVDTNPGATSDVSASVTYTEGRDVIAAVHCYRQSSLDPDTPGLSGWSTTWNQIGDFFWTTTGTTRRRMTLFHGRVAASGTGAVSATWSNAPDLMAISLVEAKGARLSPIAQCVATPSHSAPLDSLDEMGVGILLAPANSSSRVIMFVATNTSVSATARAELASDIGGDVDWTTDGVYRSPSSPAGTFLTAHYDGDPSDDLRPGWYHNTAFSTCCIAAVEVMAR